MRIDYVKTMLYAYPYIQELFQTVDKQINKRAHNSFYDFSPVEKQADAIIKLINTKYLLHDIISAVDEALEQLKKEHVDCIRYKYFKEEITPPLVINSTYEYYQRVIPEKLSKIFDEIGVDDTYFETEYTKVSVIRHMLVKVVDERYLEQERKRARLRAKKKRKEAEGEDE